MNKANDPRLVARVNEEVHQLVLRAAELSGSSISQFLVDAAVAKARDVTEQSTRIKLSFQGAENIMAALDEPPAPVPKLHAAARLYAEQGIHESHFSTDPQGSQS